MYIILVLLVLESRAITINVHQDRGLNGEDRAFPPREGPALPVHLHPCCHAWPTWESGHGHWDPGITKFWLELW